MREVFQNKKVFFIVLLVVGLACFVFAGDISTRMVQEGVVVWREVLVDYEPVYKNVTVAYTCAVGNVSCESGSFTMTVRDEARVGAPIYQRQRIDHYVIEGKTVEHLQAKSGCFVCPTNSNLLTCYGYADGFGENIDSQWQCECKSGTSCYQKSINTDALIYSRSDVGSIQ